MRWFGSYAQELVLMQERVSYYETFRTVPDERALARWVDYYMEVEA
jgi:hypothetical protein